MMLQHDKSNGSVAFTPKGAGIFVGAVIVSVIVGLTNLAWRSPASTDTDAFKELSATVESMRRDLAVITSQIKTIDRDVDIHRARPAHGRVGTDIELLDRRVKALEEARLRP